MTAQIEAPIKRSRTGIRKAKSEKPIPGLVPAEKGFGPIGTLKDFLGALPDFGKEPVGLREAIAQNRADRRALLLVRRK